MAIIRSGYACSKHSNVESGMIVHILAKEGTGFECEKGCKFIDNEELMGSNPIRVRLGKPPVKVQPGTVSLPVLVSSELRDRLQARFGDKLSTSLTALLSVMLDGDAFVVCGPEQLIISKAFGKPIKNSIELSSEVGRAIVERDEAKKESEEWKSKKGGGAGPLPDGAFRVMLTEEVAGQVRTRAKENALSPSDWLSSAVAVAIGNGWF